MSSVINTESQNKIVYVGENSTGGWDFDYEFSSTPIVSLNPRNPSSAPVSPIYVSDISSKSLTITNNYTFGVDVMCVADAVSVNET